MITGKSVLRWNRYTGLLNMLSLVKKSYSIIAIGDRKPKENMHPLEQ